jgi:uncharacterized cysteine cluster protein YcgN (CxxCxxCC family)
MTKKNKTLTQLRKEAILNKEEKALELLCKKCGACCHAKVGLSDGNYVVHPTLACRFLSDDNLCMIYHERFSAAKSKICFTRSEMIEKDYLLIESCPYVALRRGYKTARLVTQAEFDEIIARELELGNYNILLANRIF